MQLSLQDRLAGASDHMRRDDNLALCLVFADFACSAQRVATAASAESRRKPGKKPIQSFLDKSGLQENIMSSQLRNSCNTASSNPAPSTIILHDHSTIPLIIYNLQQSALPVPPSLLHANPFSTSAQRRESVLKVEIVTIGRSSRLSLLSLALRRCDWSFNEMMQISFLKISSLVGACVAEREEVFLEGVL